MSLFSRYQNSMQDDLSEYRVRSSRRRIPPVSRSYPVPGPYLTAREPYWDFTEDEDPPPQYVASGGGAPPPPLENSVDNNSSSNTTNASLSTVEQVQRSPKQGGDENSEPPPPYDSVYPPTYGEATK